MKNKILELFKDGTISITVLDKSEDEFVINISFKKSENKSEIIPEPEVKPEPQKPIISREMISPVKKKEPVDLEKPVTEDIEEESWNSDDDDDENKVDGEYPFDPDNEAYIENKKSDPPITYDNW